MDDIVERRDADGSYHRINLDKYMAYHRAEGQFRRIRDNRVDHPLLDKVFVHDGKLVKITKVVRNWWAGFYHMAVYVDMHGSHGTAYIENINSMCPFIDEGVEEFASSFVPVRVGDRAHKQFYRSLVAWV